MKMDCIRVTNTSTLYTYVDIFIKGGGYIMQRKRNVWILHLTFEFETLRVKW